MASLLAPNITQKKEIACVFGDDPHSILAMWHPKLATDEQLHLEICVPAGLWAIEQDPRIFLHLIDTNDLEQAAKELAWRNLWHPLSFHFQENIDASIQEMGEHFFTLLSTMKLGVDLAASEYSDLGTRALQNVWKNVLHMPKAAHLLSLKDSMRGIPVCICGAGPSLTENAELLRSLRGKALFFSGGSAVSALSNLNITPDLMGHIDPDPPRERIYAHHGYDIPFVYEDRVASDVLEFSHGPSLWLPGNETYPIERWLYALLGISIPTWDGGWNIATVLTAVAVWLGCDPIIFVGVDLCGKKDALYADGVLEDKNGSASLPRNREGNIYRTDWAMARIWLEEWIAKHPQHRFLQCKTFSHPLKGVDSFHAVDGSSMEDIDASGLMHALCDKAEKMHFNKEHVLEALKKILNSLVNAQAAVNALIGLWQVPSSLSPEDSGKFALYWSDLTDEPVYQELILPLWEVWQHIFPHFSNWNENQTLQKLLFYQRVLQNHRKILEENIA